MPFAEVSRTCYENFVSDPAGTAVKMRQLLDRDPAGFQEMVARDHLHDLNHRGFRYALILLRGSGLLIPALSDPRKTSFDQAVRLSRLMLDVDSDFANAILKAATGADSAVRAPENMIRLLDLTSEIGTAVTNWRPATKLCESEDQRVRSKCIGLLAKFRFDERGVSSRFENSDPRVRANLVEMLAEMNPQASGKFVQQAISDGNNRVAANALLASYRQNDVASLRGIVEMYTRPESAFKISAAWVMGQTRDSRFSCLLAAASRSSDSALHRTALRGVASLKRPESCGVAENRTLIPAFNGPVSRPADTEVPRISRVLALGANGEAIEGLEPIDFFLSRDGEPVLEYEIEEVSGGKPASLAVVLPPILVDEMRHSLSSLPKQRWWNRVNLTFRVYGATGARPSGGSQELAPVDPAENSNPSLAQVSQVLLNQLTSSANPVLLLMIDPSLPVDANLMQLESECRERGIQLYAIELRRGQCESTEPQLRRYAPEQVPAFLSTFAHSLTAGYTVKFQGKLPGTSLRLRESASHGECLFTRKVDLWARN